MRNSSRMRTRRSAVLGAVLVADNPTDHHIFLSAFTGERELHSTSAGIAARTPRGDVEIIEPVAFRDRFGVDVAADGEGMTLAGLRIGVARSWTRPRLASGKAASHLIGIWMHS